MGSALAARCTAALGGLGLLEPRVDHGLEGIAVGGDGGQKRGALELDGGVDVIGAAEIDDAHLEEGLGIFGAQLDGAAAGDERLIELVLRAERGGEVVPGARVVGAGHGGEAQRGLGLRVLISLEVEDAEVAPDFRVLRVDFVGLEVGGERLVVLVVELVAERGVELRGELLGIELERLGERGLDLRRLVGLEGGLTEIGPRLPHHGFLGGLLVGLEQQRLGAPEIAVLDRRLRHGEAFLGGGGQRFPFKEGRRLRHDLARRGRRGARGHEHLAGLADDFHRDRLRVLRRADAGVRGHRAGLLGHLPLHGDGGGLAERAQFLFRATQAHGALEMLQRDVGQVEIAQINQADFLEQRGAVVGAGEAREHRLRQRGNSCRGLVLRLLRLVEFLDALEAVDDDLEALDAERVVLPAHAAPASSSHDFGSSGFDSIRRKFCVARPVGKEGSLEVGMN